MSILFFGGGRNKLEKKNLPSSFSPNLLSSPLLSSPPPLLSSPLLLLSSPSPVIQFDYERADGRVELDVSVG